MSHADLIQALTSIRTEGGNCNRMVVSIGAAWFVFWGQRGQERIRCDAAGRSWLPDHISMGLDQVRRLRGAGFDRDGQLKLLSKNFHQEPADIVCEILELFETVYGQSGEVIFELHLGVTETLENPRLIDAMRRVSKERSQEARQEVYRSLIRADLLVPIDDHGDLIEMGTLGERPVYGLFSDWESLRHWDPRGHDFQRRRGAEVFFALAQTRAGSVLINPQGQVGGELYRNEIQAIASAIRGVRGGG